MSNAYQGKKKKDKIKFLTQFSRQQQQLHQDEIQQDIRSGSEGVLKKNQHASIISMHLPPQRGKKYNKAQYRISSNWVLLHFDGFRIKVEGST